MRAAIYCRLSEEDREKQSRFEDSASIRNQKAMLLQYASDQGWTIHDIYADDDYAGTDRSRPAFNRLLDDARAGKFDIVLCKSQSRFTRELELVEQYLHTLFPKLGIRFVSLVDHGDSENKGNKKARQINGLVNEWFLEELSGSVRTVLTSRREQGFHIGAFAPYGYRKDPQKKGHLLIDPEAAAVVREIFSRYLSGTGKRGIARVLNERGVPNPTLYKQLHGQMRNKRSPCSPLWSYSTIHGILTNEVYIGNLVQGRAGTASWKTRKKNLYPKEQWIVVRGTHDPIIDDETWNRTKALMAQKATPSAAAPEGIFSRKLRCRCCGGRMQSVKNGPKRGFQCVRHGQSRKSCAGTWISQEKLERIVTAQLRLLSEELLDLEILEQGIDPFPELRQQKARMDAEHQLLTRRVEQTHTAARSLYLDKVSGRIDENTYLELAAQLAGERTGYENQIADLTTKIQAINDHPFRQDQKKQLAAQYLRDQPLSGETVRRFIREILVGKWNPTTKVTPLEIHWNF